MLSKDMSSVYDHYYRRNNRFLRLVGLWPYQKWLDKFLRNFILNFFIIAGFFFQICQFYASGFEIESNVKELQLFVLFLCCSISYYNYLLKYSSGKKIRDQIVFDWEHLSNEEEFFIMRKYASEIERYTSVIFLIFYIFGVFLVFPSTFRVLLYSVRLMNDTQLIFPIPVKFFFHLEKQFYAMLTFEYLTIWIVTTLGIAMYSTFILCIVHACALLSLVTFKIDQPFKKVSSDVPYGWSFNVKYDAYEWIKEIVKRYENATEFIDLMNDLTGKLYLIEIFFALFLIIIDFFYLFQSFQMLRSSVFTRYIYELLMSSAYIGGTTFTLYLNSYIGQKLMDHSTRVFESFYQVSLYELPLRCQKVLPLLIMRSAKPCVLSIGGMFVASHDFFVRFMNTSLSYAMVCYKMR